SAAGQRQHRVPVRRPVVEHHVGEVGELAAGRVTGGGDAGVGERGDRDQVVAALFDQRRQLDHHAVHAGVGDDDEQVLGLDRGQVEDGAGGGRVACEVVAVERLPGRVPVQDDVAERETVGGDEAAGPAGDLHRDRLGVARAERLDHAAPGQRPGEEVGGLLDGGVVGDLFDEVGYVTCEFFGIYRHCSPSGSRCPATALTVTSKACLVRSYVRCATET